MMYLTWLSGELKQLYTPPNVTAGHDVDHCDRMAKWGPKILGIQGLPEQGPLQFDMDQYTAACWLHNIDRAFRTKTEAYNKLFALLEESPFDEAAKKDIEEVVKLHPKFADEPGDSHLLTALRIADKVDRIATPTLGVLVAAAFQGSRLVMYDRGNPFNYGSTAEDKLKSIYTDFFRQLEWYGMLPSEEARGLVSIDSMRFYVMFIRQFAADIVHHLGRENDVEDDLRKALGSYYEMIAEPAETLSTA